MTATEAANEVLRQEAEGKRTSNPEDEFAREPIVHRCHGEIVLGSTVMDPADI